MGTPGTLHILRFELMEGDNQDDSYEDVELLPATLLGKGYSALLQNDPRRTNHHQKWRQITADQWLNLLPMLVMPYLHWCQITQYSHTKMTMGPQSPCICGQNKCNATVQMVSSECECQRDNTGQAYVLMLYTLQQLISNVTVTVNVNLSPLL
jgi:hypothetical protein